MNVIRLLTASSLVFAAIGVGAVACTDESKPGVEPTADAAPSPDGGQTEETDGAVVPVDPGAAAAISAFAKEFAEAACARTTTCWVV